MQSKTKTPTLSGKRITRRWHLVDAQGQILGRVATEVATLLMGKHKPVWSPHLDTGDFVVVINAGKVRVTGRKLLDKKYYRHSGYLGGLKEETLGSLLARKPKVVFRMAVRGMLPKNKLGDRMIRKLKVYPGTEHPHGAQAPASSRA